VEDRDEQPQGGPEEDDDVSRSPSGEHQRSIKLDDENEYRKQIYQTCRGHVEQDVAGHVNRHQ